MISIRFSLKTIDLYDFLVFPDPGGIGANSGPIPGGFRADPLGWENRPGIGAESGADAKRIRPESARIDVAPPQANPPRIGSESWRNWGGGLL